MDSEQISDLIWLLLLKGIILASCEEKSVAGTKTEAGYQSWEMMMDMVK